jgi:O-antigen ligase
MNKEKYHIFIITAIAFCMPVYSPVVPPLIVLGVIGWLADYKDIASGLRELRMNMAVACMLILFLLYLAGVLYSDNKDEGFQIVETKLSFLIFPLIFSTRIQSLKDNLPRYLKAFISGCVFSAIICFIWAFYCYMKPVYVNIDGVDYDLGLSYFYYARLSVFLHPTYISMYFDFALLALYYLFTKGYVKADWKSLSTVFFLTLFVLLLSSKAGWLGLGLVTLFVAADLLRKKMVIPVLVFISVIAVLFYFLNVSAPKYSQRISQATEAVKKSASGGDLKNSSDDGTASRILVWEAAVEIIKENFLTGTGTGDAKTAMINKYLEKGMVNEYEHKLNSHDQYLNTFIAIGISGFIFLMLCLLIPFYRSIAGRELLVAAFVCLIGLNFLFESMLETQAGVMFYALFHTIFCYSFFSGKNADDVENTGIKY